MISFPNCKINLGLHITAKRQDGFHDLQTIFFPLPYKDVLEFRETKEETSLKLTGIDIPVDASNLCLKAFQLLKNDYPEVKDLEMHLHKAIPIGAGLGGGSADGAFALKMINNYFNLNISTEKLIMYSLELGSDCPFFILNKPCLATGRGEILQPIEVGLSGYTIVVLNTGIHINTGWAFKNIQPKPVTHSLIDIIQQPIKNWKDFLLNDFEKPVFINHPELADIKQMLYHKGALYASMSGSGSTIFGIFLNDIDDEDLHKFPVYKKMLIK